jgi:uncharacterized protein (DUF488 family)
VNVYTIGFTRKGAEEFFGVLRNVGIRRLLDVRLHNASQLAGFTKREDLAFFLRELCGAEYQHERLLAPSDELFKSIREKRIGWKDYEETFLKLLAERRVENRIGPESFQVPTVLLCSEPKPDHCHRRLVLEYLNRSWGGILQPVHL